jgi:hypothetical protein
MFYWWNFVETKMFKLKSLKFSNVFKMTRLYNKEIDSYLKLSLEDKVLLHASEMHKDFRQNSEDGFSPFKGYDKSWYEKMKSFETDIDLILEKVFQLDQGVFKFRNHWSQKDFLKNLE